MLEVVKKLNWKSLFNIAVMIFSIILMIYFVISKDGLLDLLRSDLKISVFWVSMAFAFQFLNYLLDSYLIYIFVKRTVPEFKFKSAFKVSMVGQFFSAVTPGASGGQPMQIFMLNQYGISIATATASQIQKFLVYQSTLVLYSIFAIFIRFNYFKENLEPYIWILALIGFITQAIVIVFILLVSYNRGLTHKILSWGFKLLGKLHIVKNPQKKMEDFSNQLDVFHKHNKEMFKSVKFVIKAFSAMIILLTIVYIMPFFIYKSFYSDGTESVINMLCSQSFVSMVSSLVPTPGASGAAELSFGIFFGGTFTATTMKSAIVLWRTTTYFVTIIFGVPFARLSKKLSYTKTESKEEFVQRETENIKK